MTRAPLHTARAAGALLLLLLFCAAGHAQPESLAAYRARIGRAATTLASLRALYTAADDERAPPAAAFERAETQAVAALRAELPPALRVVGPDGPLDVNNRWWQTALDEYEQQAPTATAPRRAALERLSARLSALADRLAEVERAPQSTGDKAAEQGRLHAILQRPEYNQTAAQGGALERFWAWVKSWLRRLLPASRPLQPGTSVLLSQAARVFIYALCLAVLGFVCWRYGPRLLRRSLTRPARKPAARIVLGERLAPEQTAADLLAAAEQLARAGDLRGAMRKAYIAVLCELGERKVLRLAQHKTNRDYLRSLRAHAPLFQTMQPLTASYERHWYGLVPAAATDWAEFRARCAAAMPNDK